MADMGGNIGILFVMELLMMMMVPPLVNDTF